MENRTVIKAFVAHIRAYGHPALDIDWWPDAKNNASPDIDAIAGPFAIEHTSVDTLPRQRQNSDWFMQAAGGLADEFPSLPYRLNITLKYGAVQTGQNWGAVRQALKSWITSQTPLLPDGTHLVGAIPDVPFEITVRKASWRAPALVFSQQVPKDGTLPNRLRQQLDRKVQKLAPYKANGKTTILLVESDDIALMNDSVMLEAIQAAYPDGPPHGVDQVWYADTSLASDIEFFDFTAELV